MSGVIRRTWRNVLAAPHLPIAMYLAYAGAGSLIAGRESTPTLSHVLPAWLTFAWSGALLVGGLLVTVSTLTEHDRPESAGHALHIFGLALFLVVALDAGRLGAAEVTIAAAFAAVSSIRIAGLRRDRMAAEAARAEVDRFLDEAAP